MRILKKVYNILVYTAEEDVHYPSLTVKETLSFALKTKTPPVRTNGATRKMFREKLLYMLTNMFGLTKQINTVTFLYFSFAKK